MESSDSGSFFVHPSKIYRLHLEVWAKNKNGDLHLYQLVGTPDTKGRKSSLHGFRLSKPISPISKNVPKSSPWHNRTFISFDECFYWLWKPQPTFLDLNSSYPPFPGTPRCQPTDVLEGPKLLGAFVRAQYNVETTSDLEVLEPDNSIRREIVVPDFTRVRFIDMTIHPDKVLPGMVARRRFMPKEYFEAAPRQDLAEKIVVNRKPTFKCPLTCIEAQGSVDATSASMALDCVYTHNLLRTLWWVRTSATTFEYVNGVGNFWLTAYYDDLPTYTGGAMW